MPPTGLSRITTIPHTGTSFCSSLLTLICTKQDSLNPSLAFKLPNISIYIFKKVNFSDVMPTSVVNGNEPRRVSAHGPCVCRQLGMFKLSSYTIYLKQNFDLTKRSPPVVLMHVRHSCPGLKFPDFRHTKAVLEAPHEGRHMKGACANRS